MTLIYLNNLHDFNCMIKSSTCIIDFYADWCGPCRMIAPIFEQYSVQYPQIKFCKVNIDNARDIASTLGIRSIPTFHFYCDGKKVSEFLGADKNKLNDMVMIAAFQE